MARKQLRRGFSMTPTYHAALLAYSRKINTPAAVIIESLVFAELKGAGLLTDAQKIEHEPKRWDPEVKRWIPIDPLTTR